MPSLHKRTTPCRLCKQPSDGQNERRNKLWPHGKSRQIKYLCRYCWYDFIKFSRRNFETEITVCDPIEQDLRFAAFMDWLLTARTKVTTRILDRKGRKDQPNVHHCQN